MKTVFARQALLPNGWADNVRMTVDSGILSAIESGALAAPGDVSVDYAMPGLGNAHSHAFQRALAGHTEERSPSGSDNFWTWRERMYQLADVVDAEALTAIARQAYCEMLTSGYTSVAEFHYLHRDPTTGDADDRMFEAIRHAARDAGIRLTYVPVHYERAGFDAEGPLPRQQSFSMGIEMFLEHHARATDRAGEDLVVGIGAHSLRAVSAESLQRISAVAERGKKPMHLHIAEQQREVDDCIATLGARPVQWLLDNYPVASHWNLVHATHLDNAEVDGIVERDGVAVLCPSTEANLGDGLFRLHDFLSRGGRIAIGSDSHVSLNPFEELRWLEYGQRLVSQSRNVTSLRDAHVGSELFQRALEGGAAACGLQHTGLQEGAFADLVVLNGNDPMLLGHDHTSRLDALVFSGYALPIERVMVSGEWCVIDGVHVAAERSRTEFGATLARIGGAS